jgi:hypothetical protein
MTKIKVMFSAKLQKKLVLVFITEKPIIGYNLLIDRKKIRNIDHWLFCKTFKITQRFGN